MKEQANNQSLYGTFNAVLAALRRRSMQAAVIYRLVFSFTVFVIVTYSASAQA
jgi:hypothetical protein